MITLKDTELLSRFPVGKWFTAKAYGIHASKLARLYRLGLLFRKAPADSKMACAWKYYRPR